MTILLRCVDLRGILRTKFSGVSAKTSDEQNSRKLRLGLVTSVRKALLAAFRADMVKFHCEFASHKGSLYANSLASALF